MRKIVLLGVLFLILLVVSIATAGSRIGLEKPDFIIEKPEIPAYDKPIYPGKPDRPDRPEPELPDQPPIVVPIPTVPVTPDPIIEIPEVVIPDIVWPVY